MATVGVKCYYCKSESNKVGKDEVVRLESKNFHPSCAQLYLDRKELYETICRIFNIKAPGPKNNAFVSKFFHEGMTYKGMTGTLIYFYDIKKNSIKNSNEGIGIIPYVYEEAKKYYETKNIMEQKGKEQLEQLDKIINKEKEVHYVRAQKREKKNHIFHGAKEFEW